MTCIANNWLLLTSKIVEHTSRFIFIFSTFQPTCESEVHEMHIYLTVRFWKSKQY